MPREPTTVAPLSAELHFVDQLLRLLDTHIALARKSLLLAAHKLPMHGVLRALNQALREIDFAEAMASGHTGMLPFRRRKWFSLFFIYLM